MRTDLLRQKEEQRNMWSKAAASWRRWYGPMSEMSREATEAIVEVAKLREGMRVLDLAGGTGEPALTIARVVGANGRVVASDLVPEMVATLEDHVRQAGLSNVTCQEVDAESIPFPDGSFDRVTCRFGVMFFPDTSRALDEIKRVLAPDGRAALVAWAAPELNPFFSSGSEVLLRHGLLIPPPPDSPGVFRFARPGSLSAGLEAAGFREVSEEQRPISWRWPGTFDDFWDWYWKGTPARTAIENAEQEKREAVIGDLRGAFQRYLVDGQLDFGATIVLASGVC